MQAQAKEISQKLGPEAFENEAALSKALDPSWKEVLQKQLPLFFHELRATDEKVQSSEADKLDAALSDLIEVLEHPPTDTSDANLQVTQKLRAALGTLAYASLKESPDNPSVKLLHTMAAAIWNDVKALDSYKELGESVLRHVPKRKNRKNTHSPRRIS